MIIDFEKFKIKYSKRNIKRKLIKVVKKYTKIYFKTKITDMKNKVIWKIGYNPLKPPPDEDIITTFKKVVRQSSNEKMAELEDIMFELGLTNKSGEYVKRIAYKEISNNRYYTIWQLTKGLRFQQFIDNADAFGDYLNANVIAKRLSNGHLYIEVIKGGISELKRYKFDIQDYVGKEYKKGKKYLIPIPIGTGFGDEWTIWELTRIIHLLVSGETGGGKTTLMMAIIDAILQNDLCRIFAIDLALKSFYPYRNHVCFAGDLNGAELIINYLVVEMERRKQILAEFGRMDVLKYNAKNPDNKLPLLILFIDEFAFTSPSLNLDSKEVMGQCKMLHAQTIKLSSLARSMGIHLIIGMQKPSAELIPKPAKDNFPGRIAFKAGDVGHSMTMIGSSKAFYLSDVEGRMIAYFKGNTTELQGFLIDEDTVDRRLKKLPQRKDDGFVRYLEQLQSAKEQHKEKRLLPRRSNKQ